MKFLKPTIFFVAVATVVVVIGCTTSQQTTALNTLSSLEQTTTAAYDGYLALVVKGTVPTNDVPKVSKLFNTFQADMIVAIVTVQGNTNAVAPANISTESAGLLSQITVSQGGK